jgi:hypothetical protein
MIEKIGEWHKLRLHKITEKTSAVLNSEVVVIGLGLWLIFFIFLALVQFSTPDLAGNDGYYHIKMAYLMRTEGLKPEFPWLPLTILNLREFYNHHFLYHVALIPFTLGDLRIGAKWATVLYASLAFLSIWWLLRNQRVRYAAVWSFGLLAVSEAFIYRMSITRAQSLSLAVLAVGLHWLFTRKYRRMVVLGFLYVWLYNAFPLLIGIAGVYTIALWLMERRLDIRPLFFSGLGVGLGLIINPYFPYNIIFAFQHIVPKLYEATSVSVGSEWFPYNTGQLLINSGMGLALFVSGALALGLAGKRMTVQTAAAFLVACLFGLMLFQSRRFIEYFPAFGLVFAALAWSGVIEGWERRKSLVGNSGRKPAAQQIREILPGVFLALILIPGAWLNLGASKASLESSAPYTLYQGSSAWLEANTPAGTRVFQTDWDDFPRLFHYNTHNTYLVGLDPTYMQLYDAELYDLWVDITQGRVEQPSEMIRSVFGSSFVLSDQEHTRFLREADRDPNLVEVYRDGDAIIFQVIEPLSNADTPS